MAAARVKPLQVFQDILERKVRLAGTLGDDGKIVGVLGETAPHRGVDQVRDAVLDLRGLDAEGLVQA